MKKFVKWGLIVLAALFVIGLLMPSDDKANASDNSTTASTPTPAAETALPIGTEASAGYFDVKINSAKVTNNVVVHDANLGDFEIAKNEPGNKYIIVDVTLKNTDKETRMMFDGELLVNNNGNELKYENTEPVLYDGYGMIMEDINPGVTKTTKLVYKIPANLSGDVYYIPARNSNDIRFKILHL